MHGRRPETSPNQGPGPGQYNVRKSQDGPAYKIGSQQRAKLTDNLSPGPGQYSQTHDKMIKSPAWGMGSGQRQNLARSSENPGPGNYAVIKEAEGPQYSILGKYQQRMKDQSPGPGNYSAGDDARRQKAPSFGMGTEKKGIDYNKGKDAPGPGQYSSTRQRDTPAFGFGSGVRNNARDSGIPGPGSYSMKQLVGSGPAKSILGGRPGSAPKARGAAPGPGQYDMMKTIGAGPKWAMGS